MSSTPNFLDLFRLGQRIQAEESSTIVAKAVLKDKLVTDFGLKKDLASVVADDILKGDDSTFNTFVSKLDTIYEAVKGSSMTILSKMDKEFVIYGPASVAITDRENDMITGPALRKALPQLLKRARLSLQHLDILVGEIVDKHATPDGKLWETTVRPVVKEDFDTYPWLKERGVQEGDEALFIVGKIYDDTKFSLDVRKQIERGELNSFSVSGQATSESRKLDCAGYSCKLVNVISDLDLSAVTICREGMNPVAKFITIQKSCNCNCHGGCV